MHKHPKAGWNIQHIRRLDETQHTHYELQYGYRGGKKKFGTLLGRRKKVVITTTPDAATVRKPPDHRKETHRKEAYGVIFEL